MALLRFCLATILVLGGVTLLPGCGETRPCSDEEVETRQTADCSSEIELTTYTARDRDAVTLSKTWESGVSVRLEGSVREITVIEGPSDQVRVTYRAQVELADGRPESFVEQTMSELDIDFQQRGDELQLDVSHPGTKAELGAIVSLELPPDFDAELVIQKYGAPGDVVIEHLGLGRVLDVDMEYPGAQLLVQDTGRLRRARLNAAGSVQTVAFTHSSLEQVVINSEEGDITTGFGVVPRSHAKLLTGKIDGDSIKSTGGDIALSVPRGGDFTLATYTKNRARFFGDQDCRRVTIADDITKLVCGAGDVDEMLTFEVISSSDIEVAVD